MGAQQRRRVGAQRAGGLVAAAAVPPHRRGRWHAGHPGLDQRGVRRRRAVGPLPGMGPVPGGGLRQRARPRGRAGRGGAHGGDQDRQDRGVRADRPAGRQAGAGRRRRHRTGRGGLQDRPPPAVGRRRAQLAGAGDLRAGRIAGAAPRLPPGGAAPPAVRSGARLGAHTGVAQPAPAAGRGRRRRLRRSGRADARAAGTGKVRRGVPAPAIAVLRLVRLPAQLPGGTDGRGAPPPVGRARGAVIPGGCRYPGQLSAAFQNRVRASAVVAGASTLGLCAAPGMQVRSAPSRTAMSCCCPVVQALSSSP